MHTELRAITKWYGSLRANSNVSFTFQAGKIYGLLGENGAGKSTLMKILAGHIQPDVGEIVLDSKARRFNSPADALAVGIGMLSQSPFDFPSMTVLENVMYNTSLQITASAMSDLIVKYSKELNFYLVPSQRVKNLSIAERQQLELLRLLIHGMQVLILDEPTTGISEQQKNQLFETLRALAVSQNKTIILVSHQLEDVKVLCDEVVILRAGEVVDVLSPPFELRVMAQLMVGQSVPTFMRKPPPPSAPMLCLHQVTFGNQQGILGNITLYAAKGEILGVAGLPGSGQLQFLQACACLNPIKQGIVSLDGQNLTRRSYADFVRMGGAYVSGGRLEEGLISGLTVAEHVVLAHDARTILSAGQIVGLAQRVIHEFQIKAQPSTLVDNLSGGNQQRLLLGLLQPHVKVLLMDDPTRGLDIASRTWVWNKLLLRSEQGTTIIFSSTELQELMEFCDRLLVFCAGREIQIVSPAHTTLQHVGYLMGGGL